MQGSRRPDYIRCYRVLGLKIGCEWEQARRHYKLLSQRWHPDRHQHDVDARVRAEKNQRAINLAMHTLTDYYKVHGCMPLRARPNLRQPDIPAGTVEEPSEKDTGSSNEKQRPRVWHSFAVALLVIFAAWFFWPVSDTRLIDDSVPMPVNRRYSSSDIGLGQKSPAALFGFGDTPEVVRFVQGEPTVAKENAWYYDKSVVYFKNGRVAGWLNDIETPLHTTSTPISATRKTIRIGSSSHDVARIQGEPLFKSPTRWDYGPSYIEFRQNRVSGWHSSPLRPLRVEE